MPVSLPVNQSSAQFNRYYQFLTTSDGQTEYGPTGDTIPDPSKAIVKLNGQGGLDYGTHFTVTGGNTIVLIPAAIGWETEILNDAGYPDLVEVFFMV